MSPQLSRPHRDWKGARVAVVGLARSGVAACLFLKKRGARVLGVDRRAADEFGEALAELGKENIEIVHGAWPDLAECDAVVLSPGVDPSQAPVEKARMAGVRILPELELGAQEVTGRIICITGTKGKSTSTMALHAMLREEGLDARAVGNIGAPITAHLDGATERSIFVAEASSFQLETTRDFRPDCAVFLNLFPDHLDRHQGFEAYAAAKARIFDNQTEKDAAIVNGEDARVLALAARTRATVIPFRPKTPPGDSPQGGTAFFDKGEAVFRNASLTSLFSGADVQIPGSAVRANLLAAATAAHHFGVSTPAIRRGVRNFRGVPHAFEKLGEVRGVTYVNDSKATTIESVKAALLSLESPAIVILGGRLKTGSFEALRDIVSGRVRSVYAIGESRPLIRAALADVIPVHESATLEAAVLSAHAEASRGDTVLLSPGCASFDMFTDYAERGEVFRRAFQRLSLPGAA